MKRRVGLLRTCWIGVALGGAGLLSGGAFAQTAPSANDAWAQASPVPWWFHGTVEAGGRFFLNNPQRNGSVYLGQNSLAKYYEYSDIKPGPFANIWLSTGSQDGLYQIDFGGKNIGYDDQSYYLDFSQAGNQYLSAGWDQSPHLYSTSAMTPYLGVGTSALTLPTALLNSGVTNSSIVNPFLQQTDLGIKRDTGSVEYRWTPSDPWDIKVDYSHMRRTGTQVDGVVGFGPTASGFNPTQVPRPVADTTQNYDLNGEYAGISPWGQRFNFKLAYNGSQYTDDFTSYTVQNPYCTSAGACAALSQTPFARLSTWPSNQANAFSGTLGADLPWMSRYAGTVSYAMMRQDDTFIPMTNNPNAPASLNILPGGQSSLNGAINTFLSNNVVTTKITSDLHSKLTYRYYDFQNNTPELLLPSWTSYDRNTTTEGAIRSLSISYTKQNASEQLTWRPSREWNLGAEYGFERYTWTRDAVDATNEHSGKLFADWKPASWFTVRSSGYYSDRRYNNYDYNANVAAIQFPGRGPTDSWFVNPAYRQLMTDNRERWKANIAVDVVVLPNLTVTPTFKYQDDYYGLNAANQLGLTDSTSWSGGVDITYMIDPRTSIMAGYLREQYHQLVYNLNSTSNAAAPGGANFIETTDRAVVDTFTGVVKYAAIPDRLDTELRYTASHAVDTVNIFSATGATPSGGQFPNVTTWFQRLDAVATYKFDKDQIALLGWKGEVKAKLHYAWEHNSVNNWSNDLLAPSSPFVSANSIWMGYNNPNYNVHLLMASLAFTW
jgi:MtrB/PioB family decaheme-associated outer membrane protein